MATFTILTWLSIFLLVGVLVSLLAKKFNIPNLLMLLLAGILLSFIESASGLHVEFTPEFLSSIALIALIMIVFDSTSRLTLRKVSAETFNGFYLTIAMTLLVLAGISISTRFIFNLDWVQSFLFASIMVGTDPSAVMFIFAGVKHHAITLLEVESIINTPLTVILPFIVLEMAQTFDSSLVFTNALNQIAPFLQQIVTGVGTGIVIALIVFRGMRKHYLSVLSPVTLIASAFLTFIIAENLGGNGVLAVTTLGLFFGNIYVQKKRTLQTFGQLFSNLFEMLVFLLFGFSIAFPTETSFYIKSFLLFVILVGIRIFAVFVIFAKKYQFKEKMFLSLIAPKGIAVGVVAFTLLSPPYQNLEIVVDLCLAFILYSLFFATIMTPMISRFIDVK